MESKGCALSVAWRTAVAVLLWAAVALTFMRVAGGAAMFCIEPPAADIGWHWKVPLAWALIYGVSAFLAIAVSCVRSGHWAAPLLVAAFTLAVVVAARSFQLAAGPYWIQTEAHWGIPAFAAGGLLASMISLATKKRRPSGTSSKLPQNSARCPGTKWSGT